jgi:hypothetical protein
LYTFRTGDLFLSFSACPDRREKLVGGRFVDVHFPILPCVRTSLHTAFSLPR